MGITPPVRAIVLAAGSSARLGSPKALLRFDERTALEIVVAALGEAGIDAGAVVVGEHAAEIVEAVDPAPFVWVRNPSPESGRLGSILVGLRALLPGADVLLWPVDRPLAAIATVRALIAACADVRPAEGIVVPESDGGRGHPLVLRPPLFPALLSSPPDANLRNVIQESGLTRREVPVNDPGIHFDLDTKKKYEKALAWWRRERADA